MDLEFVNHHSESEETCLQKDQTKTEEETTVNQLEVVQNEEDTEESADAKTNAKKSYNAPRQDHCFIFRIKKLTTSCT